MDTILQAKRFFKKMMTRMRQLEVWPIKVDGVLHTEDQDRDKVYELMNERIKYVAFAGTVKAGKSTLLNKLLFPGLDRDVLPTGETPETAKLTFISSVANNYPEYFKVKFYSRY